MRIAYCEDEPAQRSRMEMLLRTFAERKNIEYQNQLLARQVEEVQNIYLTMRGWRHDYHNHLQSMKAYVEMGQYDKLQEYLGLLENDLDQVNQLCDSGNVNLDAILNSKISLAEKNGIRVDYKATCPAELTVSDIDLCALIGNLIDNAVEACEGIADPYIRLYIGVLKNHSDITPCFVKVFFGNTVSGHPHSAYLKLAAVGLEKHTHQFGKCGFSRSVMSEDCDKFTFGNFQR